MVRTVHKSLAFLLIAFFTVSSVQAADIVETAVNSGQFKTLVAAVKAADLVKTLKGKGPFTVFAPTDNAFTQLPAGMVESLIKPKNKAQLNSILTYHVATDQVSAKELFTLTTVDTVNGQRLGISRENGQLTIAGARVINTNIQCDNGVIHVIDSVMMPSRKTIPEVAMKAGTFKTLLAAVKAAGLADVLSGEGPFTVFAPTDKAFASLPKGTVESLLKPENKDRLISILKYHVVKGRVYANQAVDAGQGKTLQGQTVSVQYAADGLKLNKSKLVATDIPAANGLIHVIDAVLLPKEMTRKDAQQLLEEAVSRGARFYNKGDIHSCCAAYEKVCRELVAAGNTLPTIATSVLSASLKRAESIRHEGERAWVLRHGIDLAYYSLED